MKTKTAKQTTVILAITLAFFLGRESKGFNNNDFNEINHARTINSRALNSSESVFYDRIPLHEKATDTVYRCGKSKIYHPTLQHGSFKICKSIVTKLTIKEAKNIGMRHCKCR